MLPETDLLKILSASKLVAKGELKAAEDKARRSKSTLEDYLVLENVLSEEALYKAAAEFYDLPFLSLEGTTVPPDTLALVPENIAVQYQLAVFNQSETSLSIATCLPPNLQIIEFIERKQGKKVKLHFASTESINFILRQYRKDVEAELEKIDLTGQELDVVQVIHGILENAIKGGASDVHIEPRPNKSVVRYRIDGILREIVTLPKEVHAGVLTRVKILSNLKVDEHRLPQDGRFKMVGPGYKVSIRTSVIPIMDGEKVVMRILHQETELASLSDLGLRDRNREFIAETLTKAQGIILVVGPTGSGKTTTLYTLLNMLNDPGVNISTIEDPIEYSMVGVNQSQVNPDIGYTFANGLRSFLRQDPDIIMVGEIRDEETAEIALHAALTGHLVLSTLHTNDAASTLPRLLEMNAPAYLIASTVRVVIAQRLVRRICKHCLKKEAMTEQQKEHIEKLLGVNLDEVAKKAGIEGKAFELYKGAGCKLCHMEGLKGRLGIYEVLNVSPAVYAAIMQGKNAREINEIAKKEGMDTIVEDGAIKMLQGLTTFEEVLRVL